MKQIMPSIKELIESGAHFGHLKGRSHPRARNFTFEVRDRVHIINLDKTIEQLNLAAVYLSQAAKDGKTILFVGTKKQIQDIVAAAAQSVGMPYVSHRWLAGTLTNFEEITKNIRKLDQIESRLEQSADQTKRERGKLRQQADKLHKFFDGIKDLKGLPDILLVADADHEKTAVYEARKIGIPVVGIADTNVDPQSVDYPVPANDDSRKTVEILLGKLAEAIVEGKSKIRSTKSEIRNKSQVRNPNS